jgi:hypothetical protein
LAQVVDAGVCLRGGASPNEVWNRNRRQKADNGHDDHDFYQGEARLIRLIDSHTNFVAFLLSRREQRNRRVITMTAFVHLLPAATAQGLNSKLSAKMDV